MSDVPRAELQFVNPVPVGNGVPCLVESCGAKLPVRLTQLVKQALEGERTTAGCPACGAVHGFSVRGTRLVYGLPL